MESTTVTTHDITPDTAPSTARRRRTIAVIAVAAAALGSIAAVAGGDTGTDDTTEIALGSTWS